MAKRDFTPEEQARIDRLNARCPAGNHFSYFTELMYHRVVQDINQTLPDGMKLRTSQARHAHDRAFAALAATNSRNYSAIASSFREALSEVPGCKAFCDANLSSTASPDDYLRKVGAQTADYLTKTAGWVQGGHDGGDMPALTFGSPYLPLSPYMTSMSMRETVMDLGHELYFVSGDDLLDLVPHDKAEWPTAGTIGRTLSHEKRMLFKLNEDGRMVEAGPMMTPDDLSGVSALRPFMSDAEYAEITSPYGDTGVPWAAAGVDKATRRPVYMSAQAISRVRDVVARLRNEGYNFKFLRDTNPGQVKIHFENGMDVRILDPVDENYAGARTYLEGAMGYYLTPSTNPGDKNRDAKYYPQSVDECLDLIKFSLGEPVERWDGKGLAGVPREVGGGYRNGKPQRPVQQAYHSSQNFRVQMRDAGAGKPAVSIYFKSTRSTTYHMFTKAEDAQAYLSNAIESARANLANEINLDMLLSTARVHREMAANEDMAAFAPEPVFSVDPNVKAVQEKYWEVLTGENVTLLPPQAVVAEENDLVTGSESQEELELDAHTYEGGPEDVVRQHMEDMLEYVIGHYSEPGMGKSFDPVGVSRYMSSPYGVFRNNDDLLQAMLIGGYAVDDLKGESFDNDIIASRLVRFDDRPGHFQRMKDYVAPRMRDGQVVLDADGNPELVRSPFMDEMFETVKSALSANCVKVDDDMILIDDNGVVRYEGDMVNGKGGGSRATPMTHVVGQIGQIFPPDDLGIVRTKTHLFVPGYEGYIVPDKPGEDLPYEERIRVRGYESVLKRSIRDSIRQDFLSPMRTVPQEDSTKIGYVGSSTALNTVIRHLYDVRYPLDYFELSQEGERYQNMRPELREAVLRTNGSRIKMDGSIMEGAGRVSLYRAQRGGQIDPLNDTKMDAITLTGGRNPAILESPGDGLFDPRFTGNGPSQGVRYLVTGAKVMDDGSIEPARKADGSIDMDAVCPMVQYLRDSGRYPDFDAVDRENMTGNGLLHGLGETEPTGVVQMSCGGWTFEDGIVVSKKFAERYSVPVAHPGESPATGEVESMRPLMKGDKIECHGNKGVISVIVDPDMDPAEAKEKGLSDLVATFRDNPELDIVLSPYSAVSRFNGGLAREGLASERSDFVKPDGAVVPGGMARVKMTILEQTADSKSHSSEDGTQKRSYGAQLLWALSANDCPEVIKDSFRDNTKSLMALREYLITSGMDLTATGQVRMGYAPQGDEQRRVIGMAEMEYIAEKDSEEAAEKAKAEGPRKPRFNKESMKRKLGDMVRQSGGFLELPFQLKYPTYDKDMNPEVGMFQVLRADERDDDSVRAYGGDTYLMPVMSAFMRSGQEFEDGRSVPHDYTNAYMRIYDEALTYRNEKMFLDYLKSMPEEMERVQSELDSGSYREPDMDDEEAAAVADELRDELERLFWCKKPGYEEAIADTESRMKACVASAQTQYNDICRDIRFRRFEGKHNIFRTGIMANKQSRSSTAVWTPDPTCSVDTVKVNPIMCVHLGIATVDGDRVLLKKDRDGEDIRLMVHRDPVLRGSGVRYMKVELDDSIAGCAVNPAGVPGGMDGDFDGDSVGLHALRSGAAIREAKQKLTVGSNLLDKSSVVEINGKKMYGLFVAEGQDITAGWAENPELKARYESLTESVNRFESDFKAKRIDFKELSRLREEAVKDIDRYLDDTFRAGYGRHILDYSSPEAHVKSVERYVADGAKGSPKKVGMWARFAGLEYAAGEDGYSTGPVGLLESSQASRTEQMGILMAKNMQQQYTGMAGKFSIRGMKALWNVCPDEVTRLTYLATQGVLQSKHDPHMSDRFEQILQGPARDVWRGYELEKTSVAMTTMRPETVLDEDGRKVTEMVPDTQMVTTWKRALDNDGKPRRADLATWKQQFMDVYGSDDGLGLKVNPELLDVLAECGKQVDRDGKVYMGSVEDELCRKYMAPLHRLAYDGTFEDLVDMANAYSRNSDQLGLFDAPEACPRNYLRNLADGAVMGPNLDKRDAYLRDVNHGLTVEAPVYDVVARSDVLVAGRVREAKPVGPMANAVKTTHRDTKAASASGKGRTADGVAKVSDSPDSDKTEEFD